MIHVVDSTGPNGLRACNKLCVVRKNTLLTKKSTLWKNHYEFLGPIKLWDAQDEEYNVLFQEKTDRASQIFNTARKAILFCSRKQSQSLGA